MQLQRCTGLVALAFFLSGYKPVVDPAQPRIVVQEVNP